MYTNQQLHHIFVEVYDGRGHHGSFLKAFAGAYIQADADNEILLNSVANTLVKKYFLERYLDNYEE